MGKKFKFAAKTPTSQTQSKIAVGPIPVNDKTPVFNFRHLEHAHNRFGVTAPRTREDWQELIKRLQHVSQITWKQIKEKPSTYHAHEISETKRHHPAHIDSLPAILKINSPFQFRTHEECRIVGFFDREAVFNIIWIDRDHSIYPQ